MATATSSPFRTLFYSALAALGVLCAVFGVRYLVAPLAPISVEPVHHAVAAHRRPSQTGRWLILHIVRDDCRYSRRVLDHLLADPRPPGLTERVVLVSEHRADVAALSAGVRARGFDLDVVTPEQLVAEYHIEGAPILVVVDPGDTVQYLGGYSTSEHDSDLQDLGIILAVWRADSIAPLLVPRCASERAAPEAGTVGAGNI